MRVISLYNMAHIISFHGYLPSATERSLTIRLFTTTKNKISKRRQQSGGISTDGYDDMISWKISAGMHSKFICSWIKRSLRTPLPLALVAIWNLEMYMICQCTNLVTICSKCFDETYDISTHWHWIIVHCICTTHTGWSRIIPACLNFPHSWYPPT